ncbi:MAG: ribosome silencing factor [Muribaculaceae bacterium]|nr:ribosome silencing factor [Muribaculaceae bacterium]
MQNNSDITPQIIDAITDKKGKKIAIVDLSGFESASTDKLIICQGGSTSQVSAIADSVREKVREKTGAKPYNYDGYKNCQWIVIDYGDIMVHVFLPEYREFYSLESLWNDAPVELIQDEC